MKLELSLSQKGFVLVGIPLVCQLLFVAVFIGMLHQAETELSRINRAKEIIETTDRIIQNMLLGGEAVLRFGRTDNSMPAPKVSINRLVKSTQADLRTLKELVRGNQQEEKMVQDASEIEDGLADLVHQARETARSGSLLEGFSLLKRHAGIQPELEKMALEMRSLIEEEQGIAARLPEVQAAQRRRMEIAVACCVIFDCCIAVALTLFFNRTTTTRLQILMDNTRRLARGQQLNMPLAGSDELAQLDSVFNDMAKSLAAAMQKERAIIENASDVICAVDADGKFTAVSPASEEVFGHSASELIGTHFNELLQTSDRSAAADYLTRVRSGEREDPLENRVLKPDGARVDIMWSINWSEAQKTFYCVAHNVTARKEIERLKQEFVAMVSHDLRTPLTSIQACLTLLETGQLGELNENGVECVSAADANINRLIALVNDLLDVEKMESGKLVMEMRPVKISALVERTIQAVGGFANQQGVRLQTDITDGEFIADADRLVQVLVNLISNAVKFSPPGATVCIAADADDDEVHFKVIDTGRGIPPHLTEAIFDRFQQVEVDDAKKKGGSGLGLAICRAIVESHKGHIGVSSEPGKGSTFWFTLPRGDNAASQSGGDASREAAHAVQVTGTTV